MNLILLANMRPEVWSANVNLFLRRKKRHLNLQNSTNETKKTPYSQTRISPYQNSSLFIILSLFGALKASLGRYQASFRFTECQVLWTNFYHVTNCPEHNGKVLNFKLLLVTCNAEDMVNFYPLTKNWYYLDPERGGVAVDLHLTGRYPQNPFIFDRSGFFDREIYLVSEFSLIFSAFKA